MLGGMRAVAQIVSYEIPVGLCVAAVAMWSGTLSLQQMVASQYHPGLLSFAGWNRSPSIARNSVCLLPQNARNRADSAGVSQEGFQMTLTVTARHMDLTSELRSHTEQKLLKLERLIDNLDIHVTLAAEKHRKTCHVDARGKGVQAVGEVTHDDLYTAIHEAVDVLARQLRKN